MIKSKFSLIDRRKKSPESASEDVEKTRRPRRSQVDVEKAVLNAASSLIEELGFAKVTLTGISRRAEIESTVFYRRYNNLDDLFDQYVRKFDYWLSSLAEIMPSDLSDEDSFKWIFKNLANTLYKNKGMQQLLIWELSDDNPTTRRTAGLREIVNEPFLRMLENCFKDSKIDINVITALLISGIYYLILHQNISTFCEVDFSSKKGKQRLEAGIDQYATILFAHLNRQKEKEEIANRLREEGVSEEVISRCLNSSKE